MPTLILTAHHPTYNGLTFGVKFEDGRAVLNEHSNKNKLGYTLEQLREKFTVDLPGYSVEWIPDPTLVQASADETEHLTPNGKKRARPKSKAVEEVA